MKKLTLRFSVLGAFAAILYACSSTSGSGSGPGGTNGNGDGGACTPQCNAKTCGDDGCGGSCGTCGVYQDCDDTSNACVAACDLTPLDGSKTIDLALNVVTVTGKVTWNGGAPPAGLTGATVYFTDKTSGNRLTAPFGATYSIALYAGTYSVGIDTTGATAVGVPRQEAMIQDNVVISAGTAVNLAATTATVNGTVTVDGSDVPQGTSRGSVMLHRSDGSLLTADIAATGAASFSVPVFTGTYDFGFDSRSVGATLPNESAYAVKGVAVTGNMTQPIALTTATISGTLTQNGGAVPIDPQNRGAVYLASKDTSGANAPVPASGAASYSLKVYAGTYDFSFDSTGSTVLPRQSVSLATGTAVSGASTQNFDLKVIDVAGALTLNGGKLAASSVSPGSISLVSALGNSSIDAAIPATGTGSLPFHIYAGTYDITVDSTTQQTVLPEQQATVQRGVALSASGPLAIDLQTAKVNGTITVDGANLADDTVERGTLVFVERTTGNRFSVSAGILGAANYSAVVYKSIYGLEFDTASTNKNLPQQSTQALDANVTADTTLAVPLKTLTASGVVTLNGATLPSSTTGTRGSVEFLDKLTGSRISADVGQLGNANYTMKVFDGGYDVHFVASTNEKSIPQVDEQVLSGCVPVDTSCTQSATDLSGTWLLNFTGWGTMELTLTQSGKTLSGYGDSTWGGGPLTSGSRTTSNITFVASSSVDITVNGDIANGCTMTGHAVASTGYTSDWVGQRLAQ